MEALHGERGLQPHFNPLTPQRPGFVLQQFTLAGVDHGDGVA